MIDAGEIITTVLGFTAAGLVMMLISFYTIKYFVRMIMAEIFITLKERVISDSRDKELKKHRNGFTKK